jgi:hypothetical protein
VVTFQTADLPVFRCASGQTGKHVHGEVLKRIPARHDRTRHCGTMARPPSMLVCRKRNFSVLDCETSLSGEKEDQT